MKANNTIQNFAKRLAMMLAIGLMAVNAWGANFNTTYNYNGQGTSWSITNADDASSYYKTSSSSDCVATVSGIFTGKTITSNVVITLDVACFGTGDNPTSTKFTIYNSSACSSQVTATQEGTLPSSSTYTSPTYTISQANAVAGFTNDLAIKIAAGTKLIRFRSFTVTFTYTSCDKSVTVTSGTSSTNGSISTITGSPVATCDATASNRTVTITVSPDAGYVAPANLTFSVTSGNAVTATKQSGPTNNVYVYSFAQNDNNSTCKVDVACVGKQCTLIFNQNGGEGGQTSNLTATYGSAMPAISGVPTRTHYTFEGYYDGAGGTGNKYYNADGTSNANWNKNTTSNTTLYAKWTEHGLKNYRTTCCTELGTIGGAVTLTQNGTSVTVKSWTYTQGGAAAESNIDTYDVYLYSDVDGYADPISTQTCAYNAKATGVTFTGLSYARTYKLKIGATANTNYCDITPVQVGTINEVSTQTFQLACEDAELAYATGSVTKTFGDAAFTNNTLSNTHSVAITYGSSDETVATVDAAGEVTILKAGTTTITATSAEQTVSSVKYCADNASYSLTVNKASISPTLSYTSTSLYTGDDSSSPTISGNTGSGSVSYAVTSASPAGCVTVDAETGVVSAVEAGTATITATIEATTNYTGGTATANFTITAASYFQNGATVFIQAESSSAWDASACVKAWFNASGAGGAAQTTYWLFNATGDDSGKKLYAAVVPDDGLNQVTLQRFEEGCGSFWNDNGTLNKASAGLSNIFRTNGSGNDNVAWKADALTMSLMSSDAWNTPVTTLTDQGGGVWRGTYEYTPSNTSTEYIVKTNYNGNIGNTNSNNNATLSGMTVGSTYNVTATLNVTAHTLVMGKSFVKGTVHFNLQGHGLAIADLTDVTAGSKISAPSAPSATGYTFGGWYKEPACTNAWDFANDVVNETMTLYAKWTANVYTITKTFSNVANEGIPASFTYTGSTTTALNSPFTVNTTNFFLPSSITVTMGGTPLTAGSDYTYNNSTGAFTFDRIINDNITITASATAKLTGIEITTDPTKLIYLEGETFSSAGAVVTATMGDGSSKAVTASAVWTPSTALSAGTGQTVTATYTEAGVEKTATTTIDVYSVTVTTVDEADDSEIDVSGVDASCTIAALSQSVGSTNYKFKEWYLQTASGMSISNNALTGTPSGNVVVYARFYKPITVTWMVGNGAASGGTTEVKYNTKVASLPSTPGDDDLVSCIPTNGKFMGWTASGKIEGTGHSAPSDLFNSTSDAGCAALTSNTTYRAVFASIVDGEPVETKTQTLQYDTWTYSGSTADKSSYRLFGNDAYIESAALDLSRLSKVTISGGTFGGASYNGISIKDADGNVWKSGTVSTTGGIGTDNFTDGAALTGTKALRIYSTSGNGSGNGVRISRVEIYTMVPTVDYADYITGCCEALGTISASNLSTSSTGTSVSVEVLTAGVNAYGDADNVSGYDFKLYTASAGGSASATYSSNSKAGTSHEFTGLTPRTDYWVTVRPIGDGSDYCNTTAESARVQITTACVAPNHVDVAGRWDRFGGETISLTATAYSTAGTGSPIADVTITGWQWQKLIESTWTDVSNGADGTATISGATTKNLQISNCHKDNSGKYRCVISTGVTCSTASATATDGTEGFDVKVYVLECYTGGTTVHNFTRDGENQRGSVEITLSASTAYTFKVHADNVYYGNNGTVNEDVTNWVCSTSEGNLTVNSGIGGVFTFTMDYSTGGSNSTEGIPELSITYPRKTIYLTPGVWNVDGAKYAFYYFRKEGDDLYGHGWTDFITAGDCGSFAEIPQWSGVKIDAVRLKNTCTSPNWDDKWGAQTSDITVSSNNSIVITGWNEGDYTYGTYTIPTYTISYATGSDTYTSGNAISGEKASETKTCGVDFTLPNAAVFTTTGYTQTGWATEDGGSQAYAFGGSYATNAAQAFYPAWTANTHSLSWSANGGDALAGEYTSGTVAYGTTIVAPNTPTWTGHRFDGWHNGSSIVTPATTMPDNDLSYTAQWSLASYSVTLTTNGGTINAGNVTSYTYGTGATLPTNVTRDGYRFDGWFDNEGLTGSAVTNISSSATGDKQYWAKWTAVHTVTWSVNGETWSSGVVDGNTYVVDGQRISALPTAPTSSDCDDNKVFVGWRATAIVGTSAGDPGSIFTTEASSPTITKDTTFYAVFADVSSGDAVELTFPDDNSASNGLTSNQYTSTWTAMKGDYSFSISNFNNNNWGGSWKWIKCGRNGNASVGSITTTTAIDFRVDSVYVTLDATNSDKINSATLEVSDYSDMRTPESVDIPYSSTGVKGMEIASPGEDKYYRIKFDCKSHTANGFVQISKVVFKQKKDTANYVTSCASCDENATFTNPTPAVSEIGCTGATLTATGGLATLGSEGCNVTDYGFVIGTADNPAIGGSGVTKLQVGTSNPTTGANFSYNATGLTKGTHYYIRAYAINRHGTAYSSSSQNFWTKDVSSIAITTPPTKTNYLVGETFDATGMEVTATMASGSTEDVTDDVTYSGSALTAGASQNFAINYSLCETAKSVDQVINVYTLTVNEGTNPSYGTAAGSVNIVSVTGLESHKTCTVTVTSNNADLVDNGNNTWTITNPTGNVEVRVDYADAAQVPVYYKVDGVTVTGLTQNVYQSDMTTLPSASELATAMTAQGMEMPDDTYPNFIGWSETEFPAQTAEPSLVTGTPTINAEKTYYAVFTNLTKKSILPTDFAGDYGSNDGEKTIDSEKYQVSNICKQSSMIQFKSTPGYLYTIDALAYIKKIEITGLDLVVNACSDNAGTVDGSAITPTGTAPYVYTFPASKSYAKITGKGGTDKVSRIDIYYAASTVYYMTQFCTRYGITGASTSGTDVIVDSYTAGRLTSNYNSACEGKSIQLEAHVNSGYEFGTWTIKKTDDLTQDVTSTLLPGDNASSLTPDAFTMPAYAITVSATITEKEVTGWTWKQELAGASEIDIPATVQLYVGQEAWFNLKAFEPADVLNKNKEYNADYTSADLAQVGKGNVTYKTRAKIVKESTTLTFTSSSNEAVQEVITIRIKALPLVHFVDLIHGELFADVVANVDASEKRTVYTTKPTPTHAADVGDPGASYNACERQHLHLIGWIESSWADAHPNAEPGEITGAGAGNYYAAGANIDLATQDGKTFYAVWSKIE